MSSSDSVILSTSTIFAHNIYRPLRNALTERRGTQLVCVLYVPMVNSSGSLAGYVVATALRLTGGEPFIGLEPLIRYPWYDEHTGIQRFPYKTLAVIITFTCIITVPWLTREAARMSTCVREIDKHMFGSFRTISSSYNTIVMFTGNRHAVINNKASGGETSQMMEERNTTGINKQDMTLSSDMETLCPHYYEAYRAGIKDRMLKEKKTFLSPNI